MLDFLGFVVPSSLFALLGFLYYPFALLNQRIEVDGDLVGCVRCELRKLDEKTFSFPVCTSIFAEMLSTKVVLHTWLSNFFCRSPFLL